MFTLNILILLFPSRGHDDSTVHMCTRVKCFFAVALGRVTYCVKSQVATVTKCSTLTVDWFLYGSPLAAAEYGLRF